MSSFIVSENCIRHIIYNLFWNHDFKRLHSVLERNGYRTPEDFDLLAIDLYDMNREAVKQRYDESENLESIEIPESLNWDGGKLNKYQALKSMQCLRYQCSEGDVPKTRLYKILEEIIDAWQSYIIGEIPEYENAEWS